MANCRSSARIGFVVLQIGILANLCLLSSFVFSASPYGTQIDSVTSVSAREFRTDGLVTAPNKPALPALRSHPGKQQSLVLFGVGSNLGPVPSTDRFNLANDGSGARFKSAGRFVQPDTRAPPVL